MRGLRPMWGLAGGGRADIRLNGFDSIFFFVGEFLEIFFLFSLSLADVEVDVELVSVRMLTIIGIKDRLLLEAAGKSAEERDGLETRSAPTFVSPFSSPTPLFFPSTQRR